MTTRQAAKSNIDRQRLIELTRNLVDIASPTGEEEPLARHIAVHLERLGVISLIESVGEGAANVWGAVGPPTGQHLLLYAPLDTVTSGKADQDTPWAAANLRDDMKAQSYEEHGWVVGLGAHNPKGHAACILMAAEALVSSGLDTKLLGQVSVGFGCLGMPADRRSVELMDGHGQGCARLVSSLQPDAAVIAKSGWSVSFTEVGLMWFTVNVVGTHTYVGSRHLLPYRNAIADAAHVIGELERWFPDWAERQSDGFNTPQGIVASIDGGQARASAFTPSSCRFTVDLRITPDTTFEEATQAVTEQINKAANSIGASVEIATTVAIAGSRTEPSEPIIAAAIEAWEKQTGQRHEPARAMSGATDANILRSHGVPTARIGLPKVQASDVEVDFQYGMNAVDPDDQVALTEHLIETVCNYLGVEQ